MFTKMKKELSPQVQHVYSLLTICWPSWEVYLFLTIDLPNNEFVRRINQPLGLKSEEMLALLRKIKYGETENESELGDSNYHSIIDVDHICDFEIENQSNNCYEQFFNQAIFDTMNQILDEMRPFGKHGYPPICFKS